MTPAAGTSKKIINSMRGTSIPNERHVLRQAKGGVGAGLHPEIAVLPKIFGPNFNWGRGLRLIEFFVLWLGPSIPGLGGL